MDTDKPPTMHRTASYSKDLVNVECQWCQIRETLSQAMHESDSVSCSQITRSLVYDCYLLRPSSVFYYLNIRTSWNEDEDIHGE